MTFTEQADSDGYGLRMVRNTYQIKRNTVRDLNHQLQILCRRNRDGSYATPRNHERILSLIADQLHALGFRGIDTRALKTKHVEGLLE